MNPDAILTTAIVFYAFQRHFVSGLCRRVRAKSARGVMRTVATMPAATVRMIDLAVT